jgi:hypothetical protein
MARERYCFKHNTVAAEAYCLHCHKPFCKQCEIETPYGKFCCHNCSGLYAAWKARWKEPNLRKPWAAIIVSSLLCLGALGLGIAWAGSRYLGLKFLAPFDLIGKFLG